MNKTPVPKLYNTTSIEQTCSTYDEWSKSYENDSCISGYRTPSMIAAVFSHYVPIDAAPIFDAGCGTGLQVEPLVELGYGPFIGIDLSDGMLSVAKNKNLYQALHKQTMGQHLTFDDSSFGAIICSGVITPGHAPPHSFDELVRIASPNALIVFSLRSDDGQQPEFPDYVERLSINKAWKHIFSSNSFYSMPYTVPEVQHRIHVYKVLSSK